MARTGTIARRYAEAAFEIALRDGTLDAWLQQLRDVGQAVSEPSVVRRLEDPQVPLEERLDALRQGLGTDMLPQVNNLVGLLLRRRRLGMLPDVAREFTRLYNRRAGIVEATATSALKLDSDEVAALQGRLEEMTKNKVQLELRVDPALLGGVQVRLGDLLIDGSVRGRLERLRGKLASGTLTP